MESQYVFKKQYKRALMHVFDSLGYGLQKDKPTASFPIPKRLLIVRWDHLGDVICALPLIHAIAEWQPKPYIAVSVSPAAALLLRDFHAIDEIIPFQAPWFSRSGTSFASVLPFVKSLKEREFDTALDLRGDLRHHMLLAAAGIPYRAGYGITGGGFLLNQVLPWTQNEHTVERNLKFLSLWSSVPATPPSPRLPWKPSSEETEWLEGVVGKDPYVVIHPDAGTSAKQWPMGRYANFLKALSTAGIQPVVVGVDRKASQDLRVQNVPFLDLIGKTSLPQLVTLIQRSSGLISTDSGPAHMGAALGRPVWVLWSGTSNPLNWKPLGDQVYIAQHHVACEYCANEVCPVSGHPCMTNLSWEIVAKNFQSSFEQHLHVSLNLPTYV